MTGVLRVEISDIEMVQGLQKRSDAKDTAELVVKAFSLLDAVLETLEVGGKVWMERPGEDKVAIYFKHIAPPLTKAEEDHAPSSL